MRGGLVLALQTEAESSAATKFNQLKHMYKKLLLALLNVTAF